MDEQANIYLPEGSVAPLHSDSIPSQFVRSLSTFIHTTRSTKLEWTELPAFIHYNPFPPGANVPKIPYPISDIPSCSFCNAYLSPFVNLNDEQKSWRCPLCRHLNSMIRLPQTYSKKLENNYLVYDIVPENNFFMQKAQRRSFCFIVEEDLLKPNTKSFDDTIKMVTGISKFIRDQDSIGLLTYGGTVTIYDLVNKRGTSFIEYDPEIFIRKEPLMVNAKLYFQNFLDCIKSRQRNKDNSPAILFTALEWATFVMTGHGGRLILLTTGRCTEEPIDLLPKFVEKRISLNVFRYAPISSLNSLVQKTCGISTHFGDKDSLISLFSLDTYWDSFTTMRTDFENVIVEEILGGGAEVRQSNQNNERTTLYPIIGSSSCFTYTLGLKNISCQNVIVQFSTFFTKDSGERLIRVVNAAFPVADFPPMPFDSASYALFLLRNRLSEGEGPFMKRVNASKKHGAGDLLPFLLYRGHMSDCNLALCSSVERFALSVLHTRITVGGREFTVVWHSNRILIVPIPSDRELALIQRATEEIQIPRAPVMTLETLDALNDFTGSMEQAMNWYNEAQ